MQRHLSSDGGRRYSIRVHQPPGEPPGTGHALIWLLDVPTTWAPMQQALHQSGNSGVVVVGIDWEGEGEVDQDLRRRDFTLPARSEVPPPRGRAEGWRVDGDCSAFMQFLVHTLQPRCLAALPVDARRQTLVGHSLSGLFVLQALIDEPARFSGYVAASPSIWWDGKRIVEAVDACDWAAARGARVLVTAGSHEQPAGPEKPPAVAADQEPAVFAEPHMVANASAFAERLQGHGIDCGFRLFEGLSHHSVLPGAMAAALEFSRAARATRTAR